MASSHFEEILQGHKPEFELVWADICYTFQDVQDFLNDSPVCKFVKLTCLLTLAIDPGLWKVHSIATGKTMSCNRP